MTKKCAYVVNEAERHALFCVFEHEAPAIDQGYEMGEISNYMGPNPIGSKPVDFTDYLIDEVNYLRNQIEDLKCKADRAEEEMFNMYHYKNYDEF